MQCDHGAITCSLWGQTAPFPLAALAHAPNNTTSKQCVCATIALRSIVAMQLSVDWDRYSSYVWCNARTPPCQEPGKRGCTQITTNRYLTVVQVAQCLSAKLYDCVCKYDRGADQGRQNPCHWSQCQGAADWLHLGQRRTQVAHSIRLRAAGNAWWIRGTSGMSDFDSDE